METFAIPRESHMDDPVLTIRETATLLKLSERTVYDMAKEGKLPGALKMGNSWRIMRDELMAWMKSQSTPASIAKRNRGL